MLQQIYLAMGELLVRLSISVLSVIFLYRFSFFFFGIDVKEQIKSNNQSAVLFFLAIIVMIGLVVGLFQL